MNQPIPQATISQLSTYEKFLESEKIPVIKGFHIDNLNTVPVEPWERKGAFGTYIYLDGTGGVADCYVCEIPPSGSIKPQRHLIEEIIYILKGRGATTVWGDDGEKHTFEWQEGSLFAPPLNTWYQMFNGQGDSPVRFISYTNAPLVINLFHNLDFIFENPFAFKDRYNGQPDYFSGKGRFLTGYSTIWETNFMPDVKTCQLYERPRRGKDDRNLTLEISEGTLVAHVSEFPVGTYKKAHRHGPAAHVVILSGSGYSTLWPEGEAPKRVDWQAGSVEVPPNLWFHQHFNTGPEPARYLALRYGGQKYRIAVGHGEHVENFATSTKEGGHQIEYEDEDPRIREMYEEECAKNGAEVRMPLLRKTS